MQTLFFRKRDHTLDAECRVRKNLADANQTSVRMGIAFDKQKEMCRMRMSGFKKRGARLESKVK